MRYNLFICDLDSKSNEDTAFGNEASIIETRTTGRVQPIHQGVNYHEKPLEFNLVFGSETPLDRYDFQEVQLWLTGYQEYQWLSICQPDMEDYQYRRTCATIMSTAQATQTSHRTSRYSLMV